VKRLRSRPVWLVAALVAATIAYFVFRGGDGRTNLRYDEMVAQVDAGQVTSIRLAGSSATGTLRDGTRFSSTYLESAGDDLLARLERAQPPAEVAIDDDTSPLWVGLLFTLLPVVLLVGAFVLLTRGMQGGGKFMQFGKAKTVGHDKGQPGVTFADVAGADEAVDELREIRDFLRDPERFLAMGARIPKGVLLFGPPGTGKTLLARAVAGEAGAPFFAISGSDFMEMFVGVGASRVRDLFAKAKQSAPAIIFVDEIDAVGRHRGSGMGGGNDEREQTLNQLLVEMDGFDPSSGVILIAATNRPDILDPALLRPGRFDRHVVVDRPDRKGRVEILSVHARGKPLDPAVSLDLVARRTPGFTGADLANVLNEGALLAARRGTPTIGQSELADAIDRVVAGPERRGRVMSDKERRVTAYHEAGHALVGHLLPNVDPIHKVSIIARGRALGWTQSLPMEDRYTQTRSELRDSLSFLLGGRTAEELIFGDPTTGAANDIERASAIARAMVTEFGMSDALGPQRLTRRDSDASAGRDGTESGYSDELSATIDIEVRRLIDAAHDEARELLSLHRSTLDRLADALIERESLDEADFLALLGDLATWEGNDDVRGSFDGETANGTGHRRAPSLDPLARESLALDQLGAERHDDDRS
jgi:cell division protease FtsH